MLILALKGRAVYVPVVPSYPFLSSLVKLSALHRILRRPWELAKGAKFNLQKMLLSPAFRAAFAAVFLVSQVVAAPGK